jgi:ribose 5-phosphate isomerase A
MAALPVEVIPFGWTTTRARLDRLGLRCELRGGENPYYTAQGHYILDCHPQEPVDIVGSGLGDAIKMQTGVVDHGLFIGMAGMAVVGKESGGVDLLEKPAHGATV